MKEKIDECDVLVLGCAGMLGSSVLKYFYEKGKYRVFGTCRGSNIPERLTNLSENIIKGVDAEVDGVVEEVFRGCKPSVVINCIGVVKQLDSSDDPLVAIPINSLLPHKLSRLCKLVGARLVHISTDCVFSGIKGGYREGDASDAMDLYGRSKLLGEVTSRNSITLRTSIIGHENGSSHSLLEWFLSRKGSVKGFTKAVFSGLPTVELARVIHDYVIPLSELSGLYHVSADPINKFELLGLIAKEYGATTVIEPDDKLVIDRSLDSNRFQHATGFLPHKWPQMIKLMHEFN